MLVPTVSPVPGAPQTSDVEGGGGPVRDTCQMTTFCPGEQGQATLLLDALSKMSRRWARGHVQVRPGKPEML